MLDYSASERLLRIEGPEVHDKGTRGIESGSLPPMRNPDDKDLRKFKRSEEWWVRDYEINEIRRQIR